MVGYAARDLKVEYGKWGTPDVASAPGDWVQAEFVAARYRIPYEVWIECSLKRPLTREEIRTLCDGCRTLAEIKAALGAVK